MRNRLDADQVTAALLGLDGWHGDRDAIRRTITVDAPLIAGFLADLETLARELDHDPAIEQTGGQLTLTMWTHSAGGVTELDIEYARRADVLIRDVARM